MTSIFRYPGGKAKMARHIARIFKNSTQYIEPFCGGASVALQVAETNKNATILLCELFAPVASFWVEIIGSDNLAKDVESYVPTVADYRERKEKSDPLSVLIINRCSHSGRGGGPIGGYDQRGEYSINARWNGVRIAAEIRRAHALLKGRTSVYCGDSLTIPWDGDVFADPPYVSAGESLYKNSFANDDHLRLKNKLKKLNKKWVLTYDDSPFIRGLYYGHPITQTKVIGASPNGGSRAKSEITIYSETAMYPEATQTEMAL